VKLIRFAAVDVRQLVVAKWGKVHRTRLACSVVLMYILTYMVHRSSENDILCTQPYDTRLHRRRDARQQLKVAFQSSFPHAASYLHDTAFPSAAPPSSPAIA
jgi:hypothetical protein